MSNRSDLNVDPYEAKTSFSHAIRVEGLPYEYFESDIHWNVSQSGHAEMRLGNSKLAQTATQKLS